MMLKKAMTYLQYLLPQHCLSSLAGRLASIREPKIKNHMISRFIQTYQIDMQEAANPSIESYATFNDFFIRELRAGIRPIASGADQIVSPADGAVAQAGSIHDQQLLQAKGMYFTLESLFANDESAVQFDGGQYSTVYLAPHNYHRVHMPLAGKLVKTIYIPGKLFSVNKMTSSLIPSLYSRNERLICIFDTAAGPMAVILVGALIVGSIQTSWMNEPIKSSSIIATPYVDGVELEKGAEMGHFKLGSTVILLFGKHKTRWLANVVPNLGLQYGEYIGDVQH